MALAGAEGLIGAEAAVKLQEELAGEEIGGIRNKEYKYAV